MQLRSLAFQTDLSILEASGSSIEDHRTHLVVRTPSNPTYYWGNFYLLAQPPAADEVADLIAAFDADFPDSTHRAFGVNGDHDQRAAVAALTAAGLEYDAGTVLTATSVHAPPRPNTEAVLRPLVSDDDWAQLVEVGAAVDEGDYEPVAHRVFLERKAEQNRALVAAGGGAFWGAFLGDELATTMGLVRCAGGLARYQSVQTHPRFRGRGLAGTLVHRVAAYGFEELGAKTLVMVADPDYLAVRIYRSVGFRDTEVQTQLQQKDRAAAGLLTSPSSPDRP